MAFWNMNMASVVTLVPGLMSNACPLFHMPISPPPCSSRLFPALTPKISIKCTTQFSLKATCQPPVQVLSNTYAREMERVSAKESLLLAIKDSGGFSSLVTENTGDSDLEMIDVNERIIALERLNPTSRPTTSSLLDGRWNLEWFGSSSSGFFHPRLVLNKFPSIIAYMTKMDVSIKDGGSNVEITSCLRLFNSMKSKLVISSKLSMEGVCRMKEEYLECLVETPMIDEDVLPQHLRSAFDYASSSLQQLPLTVREAISSSIKLPLSGSHSRLFLVSYIDEEILIIRDANGLAEVLTRLDELPPASSPPSPPITEVVVIDNES